MEKIKLEDLKCEFCDGEGEREVNRDGMGYPVICSFCNGTGIDEDQLIKTKMCKDYAVTILNTTLDYIINNCSSEKQVISSDGFSCIDKIVPSETIKTFKSPLLFKF